MKKLSNLLLIILSTFFLCGFIDISYGNSSEINIEINKSNNYIINPDYIEYEKLTPDEKEKVSLIPFKYIHNYEITPSVRFNALSPKNYYGALPNSYDLRNVGGNRYIPNIKDQKNLSLCWAFASNSTLESYLLKKNMGNYNFSENQPDYVASYLDSRHLFGSGNSIYNVVDYWFRGNSPVNESYFGPYFVEYRNKNLNEFMNDNNTAIDIREVNIFPSLNTEYYMKNHGFAYTKTIIDNYNQIIKQHIIDNGALTAGIYWYFYNPSKNLVYNNGSSPFATYSSTGHAITIIGWNDNYGDINGDGKNDGAWLAMNSWGAGNTDYFYISYYDIDVTEALVGIVNLATKSWTNSYLTAQSESRNLANQSETFIFKKGTQNETVDSVKIFYEGISNKNFKVEVSDGINSYISTPKQMNFGINTFNLNNLLLTGEEVSVTLYEGYGELYSLALFTKKTSNNLALFLYEDSKNNFKNEINDNLNYYVITKNIVSGTAYSIKVTDDTNKDITSSFTQTKNDLVNGYSTFSLKLNNKISANNFTVTVTSSTASDTKKYTITNMTGSGTLSDPYIITEAEELIFLNNSDSYYKLGKNIDMYKSTKDNNYGIYYNNGNGWEPIDFYGNLDGNGHIIYNLYSSSGGLFNNLDNATIKNIKLDSFNINVINSNYSEIGILSNVIGNNTQLSNISIEESSVYSPNCSGGISGMLYSANIENVKINAEISSDEYSGGISCIAIVNNADVNINKVFIDNSKIYVNSSPSSTAGYMFAIFGYIADTNGQMPTVTVYNNRFNTQIESEYKNPNNLNGAEDYCITTNGEENTSYNPNGNNIFKSDNYLLNDQAKLDSSSYNGFLTDGIWTFNSEIGAYLTSFQKPQNTPDISMSYTGSTINNNIILGVEPKTSLSSLKSNINIDNELSYTVYNKDGTSVKGEKNIGTGSYITINNGYDLVNYEIVVYGDVSGDGLVNIGDVIQTADYSIGTQAQKNKLLPLQSQLIAADVNKDSKINIGDVIKIANYSISPQLGF